MSIYVMLTCLPTEIECRVMHGHQEGNLVKGKANAHEGK